MLDGQLSSAIGAFQGAVLSPFLFNIHIDDLPDGLYRVFCHVSRSLYALSDDIAQRIDAGPLRGVRLAAPVRIQREEVTGDEGPGVPRCDHCRASPCPGT
ncbi:hypothetical protein PBRA_002042 [Plasmodiophora brassicae]|uniref:Uncharacterized protein n=1 Tax=Plasmodiophora brassicae TaxID=37360 RepID=A0A0G4J1H6_PLABS|nr:hypothetical protein PBRA_002042 [Plasmodiophora brassicae]